MAPGLERDITTTVTCQSQIGSIFEVVQLDTILSPLDTPFSFNVIQFTLPLDMSQSHGRGYVSQRALSNLVPNKLHEIRSHCFHNQYDRDTNPGGIVALAIAENKLMRNEIVEYINSHLNITPWHLTYGDGPSGSTALRRAVASFVNEVFTPAVEVKDSHVCICNGAGSAVDDFAFCVGEPGDGILVGRPLYVGFFPDIEARAKCVQTPISLFPFPFSAFLVVQPFRIAFDETKPKTSGLTHIQRSRVKAVLVAFGEGVDPTSAAAVPAYEQALHASNEAGVRIRAVLISNPHNPLGRPYSRAFLEDMLRLCARHDLHLLSDEVYARSDFASSDMPSPPAPFVSVLSLDLPSLIDPAQVHVIYALSKDFCGNGVRAGALISPFNGTLLRCVRAVASFTRASQLAEQAWLDLLTDAPFQKWYFPLLKARMADAYEYTTSVLRAHRVPYTPACVTSFLWLDLSRWLREDSVDAELELNWRMARAGVWLAMGASFAAETNGCFRLTFATPREELTLGLER